MTVKRSYVVLELQYQDDEQLQRALAQLKPSAFHQHARVSIMDIAVQLDLPPAATLYVYDDVTGARVASNAVIMVANDDFKEKPRGRR